MCSLTTPAVIRDFEVLGLSVMTWIVDTRYPIDVMGDIYFTIIAKTKIILTLLQ